MKITKKFLSIIAIAAIIGFSVTACGDGDDDGDGGGGGGKSTGANVSKPILSAKTQTSITVNAVDAPGNGQTVEYGRNTTDSAPSTWQDGTTFSELTQGTTHYIFARSKENSNYNAGTPSAGLSVTTDSHEHNWNWATYQAASGLRECQISGCTVKAGVGATGPAGGKIIYAAASGFTVTGDGQFTANYLEAAAESLSSRTWSSTNMDVTGANGTAIGTGKANTAAILTVHSSAQAASNAAKAASDYDGGDKNDWFLPSRGELEEMFKARSQLGIYNSGTFWSSTQANTSNAVTWDFASLNNSYSSRSKNGNTCLVRPVRAF